MRLVLQRTTVVFVISSLCLALFAVYALAPSQVLAAPQRAGGKVMQIKEAGLQYEIPRGWRTQEQKDATQITSPDGGVSIIIGLAVNDNTEAMIAGLKEYMKKDYQNFKVAGELQKEDLNGLRAMIENGSGETAEGTMEWNIVVLIGGKRPVIAFTVAEQKAFRNSQTDYIKLVQSIKKSV